VKNKYFHSDGSRRWVFTGVVGSPSGYPRKVTLVSAAQMPIQRHQKIRAEANPYDPAWEAYLESRLNVKMESSLAGRRLLLHLWKEQRGLCLHCQQLITELTGWHNHHLIWRSQGGSDRAENRVLLHPTCHQQLHSRQITVVKPRPLTGTFGKA
jgi:RNA-directed DNA polymerase